MALIKWVRRIQTPFPWGTVSSRWTLFLECASSSATSSPASSSDPQPLSSRPRTGRSARNGSGQLAPHLVLVAPNRGRISPDTRPSPFRTLSERPPPRRDRDLSEQATCRVPVPTGTGRCSLKRDLCHPRTLSQAPTNAPSHSETQPHPRRTTRHRFDPPAIPLRRIHRPTRR